MGKNKLTNAGLPKVWPAGLEEVDLSENLLRGVLEIGGLVECKVLKSMKLGKNAITGLKVDRTKVDQSRLEILDLSDNAIVDGVGIKQILTEKAGVQLVSSESSQASCIGLPSCNAIDLGRQPFRQLRNSDRQKRDCVSTVCWRGAGYG